MYRSSCCVNVCKCGGSHDGRHREVIGALGVLQVTVMRVRGELIHQHRAEIQFGMFIAKKNVEAKGEKRLDVMRREVYKEVEEYKELGASHRIKRRVPDIPCIQRYTRK